MSTKNIDTKDLTPNNIKDSASTNIKDSVATNIKGSTPIDTKDSDPHEYFHIFIINYLLQAKDIPLSNEWISEKDIPGGTTFFRGPHAIPTGLISSRFSGNIEQFKKICVQLDGTSLEMADAAYFFKITPRVSIAVLYWDGDDDFLPECKILYDKSVIEHLALDIIFALAVEVCTRIGKA
ncbi:MAG: DUF3786 domain-containing protein [Desulfamplus sp.]|nr:DUF3786 domain-containing protein [Desulfamplus sp.]